MFLTDQAFILRRFDLSLGIMMKQAFYDDLVMQLMSLTSTEPSLIANLANASALLNLHLTDINWVGFYLTDDTVSPKQLVLGPFQGKPACIRIPWGKGVCGTAAALAEIQRVADVHAFDGHIACDSASNSEIVLPIQIGGQVVAVLDIDSPRFERFDADDQIGLSRIISVLEKLHWNR